jgi:uncharacterized membrane protein YraQ (UPF0718 family)
MNNVVRNRRSIKGLIIFSLFFCAVDFVYRTVNDISYLTRENCVLYRMLPKFWFIVFEYFVELLLVVVVGVFLAALLESYFARYGRFYPKNTHTAFLYASVLPFCACTTIPIVGSMRDKLGFRTVITFVVAAPLLSPYIVLLSLGVLGTQYAILRIVSAFVLAQSSGLVLEFFSSKDKIEGLMAFDQCNPDKCHAQERDIYLRTYDIFVKLLPFLVLAGLAGVLIEIAAPVNFLANHQISNNFAGTLLVTLAGLPVYFCNGAEILFLRPLIHQGGLALGTSIAFSLASTSVCVTSFAMLTKFIGKKLTAILLANIIIVTVVLGLLINQLKWIG